MALLFTEVIDNEDDRAFIINLYEQYNRLVRKTIYSIIHESSSLDDLTQDTYEKLIKNISTIRSLEYHKLLSYIVYTAKSIALNYIKHRDVISKHTHIGHISDFAESLTDLAVDVEAQSIESLDIEEISKALLKLPEAQKNILYFKYFLDMTDDEISETMDIAPVSVRQYVRRARKAALALMRV